MIVATLVGILDFSMEKSIGVPVTFAFILSHFNAINGGWYGQECGLKFTAKCDDFAECFAKCSRSDFGDQYLNY
jgi:hypothetical protein